VTEAPVWLAGWRVPPACCFTPYFQIPNDYEKCSVRVHHQHTRHSPCRCRRDNDGNKLISATQRSSLPSPKLQSCLLGSIALGTYSIASIEDQRDHVILKCHHEAIHRCVDVPSCCFVDCAGRVHQLEYIPPRSFELIPKLLFLTIHSLTSLVRFFRLVLNENKMKSQLAMNPSRS
jgi:hypothetical protein